MTGKYKNTPTTWKNIPLMMDIKYVALVLSRSIEYTKRLCQSGELPAVKIGGEWRVEKTQLMIYCGVPKDIALRETITYY